MGLSLAEGRKREYMNMLKGKHLTYCMSAVHALQGEWWRGDLRRDAYRDCGSSGYGLCEGYYLQTWQDA